MASAGGGAAGEGEWLKVAELRAVVQAQDPRAKVSHHHLLPPPSLLVLSLAFRYSRSSSHGLRARTTTSRQRLRASSSSVPSNPPAASRSRLPDSCSLISLQFLSLLAPSCPGVGGDA
jgi:hypothetical protein